MVAKAIASALAIVEDGEASAQSGADASTKSKEESGVKSKSVDTSKGKGSSVPLPDLNLAGFECSAFKLGSVRGVVTNISLVSFPV